MDQKPEKQDDKLLSKRDKNKNALKLFNSGKSLPAVKKNNSGKIVSNVLNTFNRLPSPGTINLPLTLLIILFFVLVQVNGKTRLQWLYSVLILKSGLPTNTATNAQNSFNAQTGNTQSGTTTLTTLSLAQDTNVVEDFLR